MGQELQSSTPAAGGSSSDDTDSLESFRALLASGVAVPATTTSSSSSVAVARLTLAVNHRAGQLAELLQWRGEVQGPLDAQDRPKVEAAAAALAAALVRLCVACSIDLGAAVLGKLELNARKYPASLVRGKAAKYDAYSQQTGIGKTKAGQRTGEAAAAVCRPPWKAQLTLGGLRARLRRFVEERDWAQYHSPRNLLLALLGEVGELAEAALTLPPRAGPEEWPQATRDELGQEIADCFIYLVRFADVCGVDLGAGLAAVAAAAAQQQQQQDQHQQKQQQEEEDEKEEGMTVPAQAVPLLTGVVVGGLAAAAVGLGRFLGGRPPPAR